MTRRIFRSILAVSMTVLLASLVLVIGVLHGYFESRMKAELKTQAAYIAQGIEREGAGYFAGLDSQSRITWVDADGTVLYDSRGVSGTMSSHADREEIQAALESGEGYAARYSRTLSDKTIYYAVSLSDGTVLRVSGTQKSVWALVLQAVQPVAFIVLTACALAALIASRVSRQIVRPINEIDLNQPGKDPEIYDELTPLLTKIRSQNRQIGRQMESLRRSQEEFAAITENMDEGFLVIDLKTRVLSHNASALRLLDAETLDISGETSVYALSRAAGFRRCVEESLTGRRSEQLLSRDGECLQVIATPVFQDGHLNGAVLIILDVTEKEERESLRREFTANVSHELKTPLTSISGTAEILENGLVRPEDVPHFAGNIHREARRLIGLVSDIIKLSRLDEGGPTAEWVPCGLRTMTENVFAQLRTAAEKKQVSMTLAGEDVSVRAMPQILEEILYNLCDNAVAYNRTGGSVTVTVDRVPGDGARVTVADTGAGIPAEARERIFERFFRVDKSHSAGGTGLGLSIVKHGASYLGAQVKVRSEVGKGSTFTLTFPGQSGTEGQTGPV